MKNKEILQQSFSSRKANAKPSNLDIERIASEVEPSVSDEVVKTSLDFPIELYQAMKLHLLGKRQKMKDYILNLIRQDLNK
jgi:hypothetical protein